MTLTENQKKTVSDLIIANIGDLNEVEEFNFTLKCSECTNEEIDILDQLCADPSAKHALSDFLWVSVRYSVIRDEYEISGSVSKGM